MRTTLFLLVLVAWGYQLCQVDNHLGPSHPLLVCSKYILYTSRAVTGDAGTEIEGDPNKDQYYIQVMEHDECFDLEIGRELYDNTAVGDAWEYRAIDTGGVLFRPRKK